MDRGYIDFTRLHRLTQAAAFFVVRGRANFRFRRLTSHPVDKQTGLICDQTIARLYKCRWQVELFFKWIKQHLRIKRFFGNTENAVKTQVWIAVSIYVLVAIMKKRLDTGRRLCWAVPPVPPSPFRPRHQLNPPSSTAWCLDAWASGFDLGTKQEHCPDVRGLAPLGEPRP